MQENHKNPFSASGSSPTEAKPDFICENHGSIFPLRPISPAAFEWIDSSLSSDRQTFGDAVAVEARFVWPIILGIQDSGLSVVPR